MYFKSTIAVKSVGELNDFLRKSYEKGQKQENGAKGKWRFFVILFLRPGNILAKNELLPNLDFFHYHTGDHVDFFCPGYNKLSDSKDEIVNVGIEKWGFSNLNFNKIRLFLEANSKWKYSGQTDLIIANYKFNEKQLIIDFGGAISFNLEEAIASKAISGPEKFLVKISNFSKDSQSKDPVWNLSKKLNTSLLKNSLSNFILNLLPENMRKEPQKYKTFMHENLRK